MKLPRSIAILAPLLLSAPAIAQVSLSPPPATTAPNPSAEKPKASPQAVAKKKEAQPAPKPSPSPTPPPATTVIPAPQTDNSNVDLVFGAYQRGHYKTALDLATVRAQAGDPKAMTMLGELYANALGTKRDYVKAVEWYKRAADAGDREAMFALAMM